MHRMYLLIDHPWYTDVIFRVFCAVSYWNCMFHIVMWQKKFIWSWRIWVINLWYEPCWDPGNLCWKVGWFENAMYDEYLFNTG